MATVGERLRGFDGSVPGFDGLRLGAALLVLFSHAFPLTSGDNTSEPLYLATNGQLTGGSLAVTAFFAVSGFVIAASLDRSSRLGDFIFRRALRLLPALSALCLATVFALGPLFTSTSMEEYFGSPQTWLYLLNVVFITQYDLPGVFSSNTYPSAVNGSLWTLRWEVLSYVGLTLFWFVSPRRWRWAAPLTAAAAIVCGFALSRQSDSGLALMLAQAALLFGAFMCGASLYILRETVPASPVAAVVLLLALPVLSIAGLLKEGLGPIVAYACVVFSLRGWPRLKSDYSYGVYLWAFPVQQGAVALGLTTTWWSNVLVAAPLTLLLAALSWRFVEAPALRLKKTGGTLTRESRLDEIKRAA